MKIDRNDFIKIGLSILLILCLFGLSFGEYEIIRFVLIALFAWLAISEDGASRKGKRFLYIVFVVLFNPFFKLKIGVDLWHTVDIIVSIFLFFSTSFIRYFLEFVSNNIRRIKFKKIWIAISSDISKKVFKTVLLITVVLYLLFNVNKQYKTNQKNIEIANQKRMHDSLFRVKIRSDSIYQVKAAASQAIENKRRDSINALGKIVHCNEQIALKAFKAHMKFYYPTWIIKKNTKIIEDGDCSFKISAVIYKDEYGEYSADALIVQISFWGDGYGQYSFNIEEKPPLFEE